MKVMGGDVEDDIQMSELCSRMKCSAGTLQETGQRQEDNDLDLTLN